MALPIPSLTLAAPSTATSSASASQYTGGPTINVAAPSRGSDTLLWSLAAGLILYLIKKGVK